MVRTKDEILKMIRDNFEEVNADVVTSLFEDITDSWIEDGAKIGEMEAQYNAEREAMKNEYEARYKELDDNWRNRYLSRFSGDTGPTEMDVLDAAEDTEVKPDEEYVMADLVKEDE